MAEKELKSRLVQKHDIQANWEKAVSFIPKQGEIIVYDKDESFDYVRVKIGDGQTPVNDLAFAVANIADIPTKTSELTNDSGFINLANQQVKMPSSQDWQSVTYGNNKFVAIAGSSNTAAYSEDGINWVATTMPSSQPQDSATYGNGKFVAIAYGSNIAAYSEDGINWTETTMPSSKNWKSVTYGNGKFVAVAVNSDIAAYSIDGISWIAITMPSSREWWSVTYGNGKFVAVVYGSKIAAYSEDGITWTETTMPSSTNWRSVTYGNDKFVAVAASSSTAAYSEDGIIWTKTMRFNSARWFSVTYGNGKFVVVAYDSDIAAYSEDGINWTETTLPISQDWFSVTYGNGKFVAVGLDSDIVAYSIDGINWKIEFTVLFQNDVDITDDIIPTKTSELTNDSGFITAADIPEVPEAPVKSVNGKTGEVVLTPNDIGAQPAGNYLTAVPVGYATETYVNNKVSEIDVPAKTSELTNDSGFITASDIPEIPTKTSDLTNDSGFITSTSIPTKTSQLQNDSGFITASDIPEVDLTGYETKTDASSKLTEAKNYTDKKISGLINSAPTTLDTLGEIAAAMEENADVVEALESAIGTKANAGDLTSHINNKTNPHNVTLSQLGVTATAAELNYVDGVTSNVQTQLNAKVPTSRTINGKALSTNITLSASDIGADASGAANTALNNAKAYTDAEITEWVGNKKVSEQISAATVASANKLATGRTITLSGDVSGSTTFDGSKNVTITATVADDSHNHTIANVDNLQTTLDGKANTSDILTESGIVKQEILPDGYPYEMIEELEGEFDGDYTKWEYIESSHSSSSPCFYRNYAKVSNKTFTMDELNDVEFVTSIGYIGFADSSNTTDHGSYISIGHPAMVDKDVIVIVHEPCEYDGAYLTTGTWFGCSNYNDDWIVYLKCLPYFDKKTVVTMDSKYLPADIPTKTSDLTNDSGFITASDIPEVPTKLSELENDLYFNNTFTLSLTEQDFAVDATLKKLAYIGSPAFGLAAFDKDEIDVVYTFNMTTADGTITAYDNITYPRAVEKLAIGDGYYIRTYFGQPMAMKPQFMFRDGVDVNGNLNNTFIIQEASTITSPIKNLVSNGGTFTLDVTFIIKKEIPENVLPLICSQDTIKLLITTINAHSNITDNKGNYWDENTLELARMFNVVFDNGYNKGSKYIYYYENGVKTEAGLVRFSNGEFRYFLSDGSMCYGRTYYPTVTNGLLPSVALVFGEDGVITNSIYTMTQNLTNITSDYDCQYIPNTTTSITINLTANTNYTISSVEITMDGSDKSSWYSNGVITIPASSVTGDVVITAVAS